MAGIEADRHRSAGLEALHQLGHLLQLAAERKLRARRILNQDAELRALMPRSLRKSHISADRPLDRLGRQPQPLFARQPLPASRVQHQELRAQRQRALHLSAKRHHRVRPHGLRLAAQVDQIAGVDGHRPHVILRAQLRASSARPRARSSPAATSAGSTRRSGTCSLPHPPRGSRQSKHRLPCRHARQCAAQHSASPSIQPN